VARRPRWLANPEACRRRLVFGLPGLHEKQLIWSADLDDALIECLKLDVRLRVPRLRATPQADLRLRAVDDQSLGFGSSHGAGVRVPRDRYVQLAAEERTLAHRWPALFQRPFVHHGRLRGSWP
jgi:hypothetical protein